MPNWTNNDVRLALKRNPHLTAAGAKLPVGPEHEGSEAKERAGLGSVRPKLERHARSGRMGKKKTEGQDHVRFLVRVTRVGKLLDYDNLCIKIAVDLCRYAGCLPGDDPSQTQIEAAQRTPEEGEEDHALIEVWKLNNSPDEVSWDNV
jgi:hypothetical protein